MNVKQIESLGMNLLAVFGAAVVGALYNILQQGDLPHDWNGVRKLMGSAAFAGALAVFGWIKMHSPWAKPQFQFNPKPPAAEDSPTT